MRQTTEVVLVEHTYAPGFQKALTEKLNESAPTDTTLWDVVGFSADKNGYSALLMRWRED